MDSVGRARGNDFLAVEIGAAEKRGEGLEMARQLPAPTITVHNSRSEIGKVGEITDGRRTEKEQFRGAIIGTGGAAQNEPCKHGGTGGNLRSRDVEKRLQVIAAEHQDHQIDRLVTFETGW